MSKINYHIFFEYGKDYSICRMCPSYEGTDGTKRYITEIIADNVEFLANRGAGADGDDAERSIPSEYSEKSNKEVVDKFEPIDDDNLPF